MKAPPEKPPSWSRQRLWRCKTKLRSCILPRRAKLPKFFTSLRNSCGRLSRSSLPVPRLWENWTSTWPRPMWPWTTLPACRWCRKTAGLAFARPGTRCWKRACGKRKKPLSRSPWSSPRKSAFSSSPVPTPAARASASKPWACCSTCSSGVCSSLRRKVRNFLCSTALWSLSGTTNPWKTTFPPTAASLPI